MEIRGYSFSFFPERCWSRVGSSLAQRDNLRHAAPPLRCRLFISDPLSLPLRQWMWWARQANRRLLQASRPTQHQCCWPTVRGQNWLRKNTCPLHPSWKALLSYARIQTMMFELPETFVCIGGDRVLALGGTTRLLGLFLLFCYRKSSLIKGK